MTSKSLIQSILACMTCWLFLASELRGIHDAVADSIPALEINQTLKLEAKHKRPLQVVIKETKSRNALDITADTLMQYEDERSILTVQQKMSILDLANQLNGPSFFGIEDDIISASSKLAKLTLPTGQRLEPPEDTDSDPEEEEDGKLCTYHPDKAESLLSGIAKKIKSMASGIIKAAKIVSRFSLSMLELISVPITRTLSKFKVDHTITTCSKLSFWTVAEENKKLEALINNNNCDISCILEHALTNLSIALNQLRCLTRVSSPKNEELENLNEQLKEIYRFINVIQRKNKSLFTKDFHEIFEDVLDLQDKLFNLSQDNLIIILSDNDMNVRNLILAIQKYMRDFLASLSRSIRASRENVNSDIENKDYFAAMLESSRSLGNVLRKIGTTHIDKLMVTAREITDSFEGLANVAASGIDKFNSCREMYEQFLLVSKKLQDSLPNDI